MSELDKNTYYGKISKLTRAFNKMDIKKDMVFAINDFRKENEVTKNDELER